MLDHALFYRSLGWNVFPMARGEKRPLKSDRVGEYRHTPIRLEKLTRKLTEHPERNLGVILGPSSDGLAVRDFDCLEAYRDWQGRFPKLNATLPTVLTRRGAHVYFRCDIERMHQMVGKVQTQVKFNAEGELKYNGAYTALPPSRRFAGPRLPFKSPIYWFEDHLTPISESAWEWRNGTGSLGDIPLLKPDEAGLIPEHWLKTHAWRPAKVVVDQERKSVLTCICIAPADGQETNQNTLPNTLQTNQNATRLILSYLPTEPGTRNATLFTITRRLKLLGWDGDINTLKPAILKWHSLGFTAGIISTPEATVSWQDFTAAWKNCRILSTGFLTHVAEDALHAASLSSPPPSLETRATHKNGRRYRPVTIKQVHALGHYCRLLAEFGQGDGFILPVREVGQRLGFNRERCSWAITKLKELEVIRLVETHDRLAHKAARYKYSHGNPHILMPDLTK